MGQIFGLREILFSQHIGLTASVHPLELKVGLVHFLKLLYIALENRSPDCYMYNAFFTGTHISHICSHIIIYPIWRYGFEGS